MKLLGILVLLCSLAAAGPLRTAEAGHFPLYDEIRPQVAFWTEIYSRYYSTQGLLHDRDDLRLVYTVLEVENTWDAAARRRNQDAIKEVREHYQRILRHLAAGNAPRNAEERRVQALFGQRPDPQRMRQAADNIRFQRGLRDRFQEGVIRSGAYLEQIKSILRGHGLPEDLAYLPHVESSFNYEAYSRLGAAGIWQFMPATGRQYMTVDYVLDERRDPIRATHAAARLLRDNHQRLGSWPLAITAYNHGATGMARAQARHGDFPSIIRDYDGPRFGFASRNFYAEFLAAVEVAKNAERYFGRLQREPERRSYEIVLPAYVPLAELARHLGLDIETLRRYNPGLRPPVFAGDKYLPRGYHLRVPDRPEIVRRSASLPANILLAEQKRSAFYTVRRGDTAGEIARRHRVSLPALIAANQLDRRATIYAGQNLRIPGVGEEEIRLAAAEPEPAAPAPQRLAALEVVSDAGPVAAGAETGSAPGERPAAVNQSPAPALVASRSAAQANLQAGSLAASESEAAGTLAAGGATEAAAGATVSASGAAVGGAEPILLASARRNEPVGPAAAGQAAAEEANGELLGSRLALSLSGDTARLPGKSPASGAADLGDPLAGNPAVITGKIRVERTWREGGRLYGEIRVEVEETLGHYADWLGIRTQELRRLNGLSFGQNIRLDQRLRIPLDGAAQAAFEEQRYEFHKAMAEDFYQAYRVEGLEIYQIRPGDSIWALSRDRFELPLWLLRRYNPELDFNNLQPGLAIKVPQLYEHSRS